jgi:hypothetical protein
MPTGCADEVPDKLDLFRDTLYDAGDEWARPISLGEWWDRPAVPFHVILHSETDALERWGPPLQAYVEPPAE